MTWATKSHIFDHLAGARNRFGRLVHQITHEIAIGLEALHRVQFEEPWKPARRPTSGEW